MPGLLERGIDRELGPSDEAEQRARDGSWLRDWPLLLGLVLSAALVAASTTVGGPPAAPASVVDGQKSAGEVRGEVVDVGEEDAVAAPKPVKRPATKERSKKQTAPAARTEAKAVPAEDAAAAPADTAAAEPGTKRTPTRRSGGSGRSSSGGGAAQPGKIVNVTGTSAAFSNGPLSYAVSAPNHTPTVGKRWRLQISGKRSGAPLAGTVKIDILHNGSIVGHATTGKLKAGRFAHDFDWPVDSVGHPLTVKTTVVGGGFQQSFLFGVRVRKAG